MNPYLIISIIAAYFGVLILISFITSKGADNDSFFVGNRKSPWFIVAFGMIGTSLSGVTFISVPGWIGNSHWFYYQMVMGYLLGYIVIANILLPLYYKLNLVSIYKYLEQRFGVSSYKTGASFFLISRTIGASFRLFLVANVLQLTIFNYFNVPFIVTVLVTIALIWVYTFKGGIKTIVWTDTLQTLFMILAVIITIIMITRQLDWSFGDMVQNVVEYDKTEIFNWDWKSGNFFFKQFLAGAFITIVMTGLDQDMMQKNLTCKSIGDAKKNVYWYGSSFLVVNVFFLALGTLLYLYVQEKGISFSNPESFFFDVDKGLYTHTDDLYPILATQHLGVFAGIVFLLGIIAAAFSSADSALAALTTSFTLDILGAGDKKENDLKLLRRKIHILFSIILAVVIIIFNQINDRSVIHQLFVFAGYTYGPLLGMYAFGLFTSYNVKDRFVPLVAIISPLLTWIISYSFMHFFHYTFGYELLLLNGLLTFIGMRFLKHGKVFEREVPEID